MLDALLAIPPIVNLDGAIMEAGRRFCVLVARGEIVRLAPSPFPNTELRNERSDGNRSESSTAARAAAGRSDRPTVRSRPSRRRPWPARSLS